MAPHARPERQPTRAPLNRERVLRAAVKLADSEGIGALTMRRLAQELGVEAMSLYHHVANKDEILDRIVDAVVDEFELPSIGGAWKAELRGSAVSACRALLRHPWAAPLVLSRESPGRFRYMNAILGTLREAGFSADLTDHAYHAIDSHVIGFAMWVTGLDLPDEAELAALATDFLEQLPRAELPYLAEHVEQHRKPRDPNAKTEFEFGLDLILDGLERMLPRT